METIAIDLWMLGLMGAGIWWCLDRSRNEIRVSKM